MIPITLTRAGRVIGTYSLYEIPDDMQWACIAIAFAGDNVRTITRTNNSWSVELDADSRDVARIYP